MSRARTSPPWAGDAPQTPDGLADAVCGSGFGADRCAISQLGAIFADACAGGASQIADRVFACVECTGSFLKTTRRARRDYPLMAHRALS